MIDEASSHVPVLIVLMRGSRGLISLVRRRQVALYFEKKPTCKKLCDDLYRSIGVGIIYVCSQ